MTTRYKGVTSDAQKNSQKRVTMKELVGNEIQYNKTLFFHVNVSNKSGIYSAIRYSACTCP